MDKRVRTRFAPSPTGHLHVGGARTALYNYLWAKKNKGEFILRFEDTDLQRSKDEYIDNIKNELLWLNIKWDKKPFRQTERLDIYSKYANQLLDEGKAYYCFCTKEELEKMKQEQLAKGLPPKYDRRCRNLTKQQIQNFLKEGRKPVIRFKVEDDQKVLIQDHIRGEVEFDTNLIGDFIIMKSNKTPSYNFAVVIDDHLMDINWVIRGDEHLINTARQVLIYEAFNWQLPKFAHISMILSKDRTKLSKRHGTTSVFEYKQKGYVSEALVNYLALLGWSNKDNREIFSIEELIKFFDIKNLHKSAAIFDEDKLKWFNSYYLTTFSEERIYQILKDYNLDLISKRNKEWFLYFIKAVKEKANLLSDFEKEYLQYFESIYINYDKKNLQFLKEIPDFCNFLDICIEVVNKFDIIKENIKQLFKKISKKSGKRGKMLYMPIRIALTGLDHGFELKDLLPLLGKELILKRFLRLKEVMKCYPQ